MPTLLLSVLACTQNKANEVVDVVFQRPNQGSENAYDITSSTYHLSYGTHANVDITCSGDSTPRTTMSGILDENGDLLSGAGDSFTLSHMSVGDQISCQLVATPWMLPNKFGNGLVSRSVSFDFEVTGEAGDTMTQETPPIISLPTGDNEFTDVVNGTYDIALSDMTEGQFRAIDVEYLKTVFPDYDDGTTLNAVYLPLIGTYNFLNEPSTFSDPVLRYEDANGWAFDASAKGGSFGLYGDVVLGTTVTEVPDFTTSTGSCDVIVLKSAKWLHDFESEDIGDINGMFSSFHYLSAVSDGLDDMVGGDFCSQTPGWSKVDGLRAAMVEKGGIDDSLLPGLFWSNADIGTSSITEVYNMFDGLTQYVSEYDQTFDNFPVWMRQWGSFVLYAYESDGSVLDPDEAVCATVNPEAIVNEGGSVTVNSSGLELTFGCVDSVTAQVE